MTEHTAERASRKVKESTSTQEQTRATARARETSNANVSKQTHTKTKDILSEAQDKKRHQLIAEIKHIINTKHIATHQALLDALTANGFEANQSLLSRLLTQMGIIKSISADDNGMPQQRYHLPWELSAPSLEHNLQSLVTRVEHNEAIIVVSTSPGAAQLVARIIDYEREQLGIIGTIAGDDMIFVAPESIGVIDAIFQKIEQRFL